MATPRPDRRRGGAALALLLLPLLAGASAQDGDAGLAISPAAFAVGSAQPGETYQLAVTVQNRRGMDDTVDVALEGAAGAWASTEPAGRFALPSGQDRQVVVRVAVPAGAGPGPREGLVRFTGQPGGEPDGTGAGVRPSLGLLLNVTVGGEPAVRLSWLSARAEDAQAGQPVRAFVRVRNDGNVRAAAEAAGEVQPFPGGGAALSTASGSLPVAPGEAAEVPLTFPAGLAPGQYLARLGAADGSFAEAVEFKVVPPGAAAPSGLLRGLEHEPRVRAGRPVRVDAWFENAGNASVASARFHGEVRRGGTLLAVLESEALAVPAGTHANLTAYHAPSRPGTYLVTGHVTYDGYRTLERESLLTVEGGPGGGWPWWWLLVAAALLLAAGIAWARRRRARRRG